VPGDEALRLLGRVDPLVQQVSHRGPLSRDAGATDTRAGRPRFFLPGSESDRVGSSPIARRLAASSGIRKVIMTRTTAPVYARRRP